MKNWTLLFLRISLGWLLVIWGADKIFNVEHGIAVANTFYFGFLASETLLPIAGAGQILLGLAVVLGLFRRWVYPVQLILNTASLVAVATSIIDPWGWFIDGTNALFYPSLIILAASLLVMGFRDEDRLALDKLRQPA
ncbi:DoxX family membrane protein [Halopseudomonas salegens]|uniref:Uncharacterized membrane protein YphA, DoxX/SURF4 family n=1 Tax=Halopseudomonas salegens TaxID=1434072 RepID=A0A1H2DZ27_9GAMM|nr:DoxX family membrane protein [Halopseudomonas salegens]SDT88143.1 Uncharacterized membrane protein YphA, DoxX/SURF4 family [Halopseudomonas salegens]